MPTWCHMFNSTLSGYARVWFDNLPPESMDSYDNLKKAFLVNFLQHKKCIKDPVEIHHIKQREEESTEDFMKRFKTETRHVNGASECMRISGFMHEITNSKLIKHLHENIPRSVDKMMRVTTTFLRGELAASSKYERKYFWRGSNRKLGENKISKEREISRINKDQSGDVTKMDLFTFINHVDPTKVQIGKKKIKEGQVPLLKSTKGRVVSLVGVNEQGKQNDNVQDVDAHVVQDEGVNIVADEEVVATVVDKPKGTRKKRNTANLIDNRTLAAEVGVTAAVTVPFVTSSVTLTQERESDGRTDSISETNLQTWHPAERFVVSSDSSHHSSTNAVDDEVTSIVRSPVPPPPVMAATIATTAIASVTSASVLGVRTEPSRRSLFRDSASPCTARVDIIGPSQPAGVENMINDSALDDPKVCRSMVDHLAPSGFFSQLRGMEYEQLFAEFNVGVARQACFSVGVRLRSEHNY
nr:reverse transcriptase domain-containing protein [Tanacetum cinerariifolium]